MVETLPWLAALALLILLLVGVASLAHKPPMSQREYDERLGKANALGNALSEIQEMLGPGGAENLRKAKTELREEADPSGDPPEPPDPGAGPRPGDPVGRERRTRGAPER